MHATTTINKWKKNYDDEQIVVHRLACVRKQRMSGLKCKRPSVNRERKLTGKTESLKVNTDNNNNNNKKQTNKQPRQKSELNQNQKEATNKTRTISNRTKAHLAATERTNETETNPTATTTKIWLLFMKVHSLCSRWQIPLKWLNLLNRLLWCSQIADNVFVPFLYCALLLWSCHLSSYKS